MKRSAECYKSYAQYKRICPELRDYSQLMSSLNHKSEAELQSLYTLLKKEYATLIVCDEKRTFVFENCYDDNDQGHKKAIDIVKEQQRQCLGFLTLVANELQARYTAMKDKEEQTELIRLTEEQLMITPSQAKRAKKKASKQRKHQNDVFKREIQKDAEYQAALAELDRELERVERAHHDVKGAFLNRLRQHIRESPFDQRYQYFYDLTENKDDVAFYIWDSKYGGDYKNVYVSGDVIRKTDVAIISDADIDRYIDGVIGRLVDLKSYDDDMVKYIINVHTIFRLPVELYINIARFVLYGFVEDDQFITSGARALSNALLELVVLPTVESLTFPNTKLYNDVYSKKYLKRFGEHSMVVKDRLERFHALVKKYFDSSSEDKPVSWYYFDRGIETNKTHNLLDLSLNIDIVLRFSIIIDNTPEEVFNKIGQNVLSMYTNVKTP